MKSLKEALVMGVAVFGIYMAGGVGYVVTHPQPDGVRTVNLYQAEDEASAKLKSLGPGWECWAEINSDMPDGYEVICNNYSK